MFILIFFRNNFCFLVGDPDVGTVAPDLIIIQAGQNDDGHTDDENHDTDDENHDTDDTPHSCDDHGDHIDHWTS